MKTDDIFITLQLKAKVVILWIKDLAFLWFFFFCHFCNWIYTNKQKKIIHNQLTTKWQQKKTVWKCFYNVSDSKFWLDEPRWEFLIQNKRTVLDLNRSVNRVMCCSCPSSIRWHKKLLPYVGRYDFGDAENADESRNHS